MFPPKRVTEFDAVDVFSLSCAIQEQLWAQRYLGVPYSPILGPFLTQKINFLNKVNTFAREIDERVKEVSVSLNGNHQNIEVITKNGDIFYDSRPLVRMNINITIQKKNKVETGSFGMGGRYLYDELLMIVIGKME